MFRFTIRDLLWLTVVVALGVVWLADRQTLARASRLHQEDADKRAFEVKALVGEYQDRGLAVTFMPDGSVVIKKRR